MPETEIDTTEWQNLAGWVEHLIQGRDPADYLPWKFTPYSDEIQSQDGVILGSIGTPNGRRPDGSMHTAWMVVGDVWRPTGEAICAIVNEVAARAGFIGRVTEGKTP